MKQQFLSITRAFAASASAHAQSYRLYNQRGQETASARPKYSGGYNFYNQWGQETGSARPKYSGGEDEET